MSRKIAAPLSRCRRAFNFSVLRNGTFFDGWRAYGKIPSITS
jgi:hypothetical protein